ncbi:MAG: hypothetical protein ACYSR6_02405 [Planctomycetota bacterium]
MSEKSAKREHRATYLCQACIPKIVFGSSDKVSIGGPISITHYDTSWGSCDFDAFESGAKTLLY